MGQGRGLFACAFSLLSLSRAIGAISLSNKPSLEEFGGLFLHAYDCLYKPDATSASQPPEEDQFALRCTVRMESLLRQLLEKAESSGGEEWLRHCLAEDPPAFSSLPACLTPMPNIMEEHRNSPSAGNSRTPVGKGKKQKKSAAPAVPYSKEDSFTSTSRSRYLKDAATLSSSSSIPETSAAAPLGQNAVSDIPPVFQVPRIGSGGRPNWLPMPGIPLGLDLGLISANLKNSVSLRTWEDYLRAWSRWDSFCSTYNLSIASCNAYTALSFVIFLIHSNLSAASIHKILAGVSFFLKFFDLPALSSFYTVRQVLKGFRRSHLVRDGRRPISIDLLVKLIQTLPSVCYSPYEILLFNAAFSLAFFGALRLERSSSLTS
ncbi:uncharacterized protein LOC143962249 [Lithobates pipiens]